MMKSIIGMILLLLPFAGAQGQSDILLAGVSRRGIFLTHVVRKKENYYSLGRMYHIRPEGIARANRLTFKNPLRTGMSLMIPLTRQNFSRSGNQAHSPGYQPVYHRVLKGETLFHICMQFGRLPESRIRNWNHLKGQQVNAGSLLVVGWARISRESLPPLVHEYRVAVKPPPVNRGTYPETSLNERSATPLPLPGSGHSGPDVQHFTQVPGMNSPSLSGTSPYVEQFAEESADPGGLSSASGAAGWFRSSIPPGSLKYYALQDSVSRGTIVRVTNPLNGRFILVKVLDSLPVIAANENLLIRISDAAKKGLGITSGRFFCKISYPR